MKTKISQKDFTLKTLYDSLSDRQFINELAGQVNQLTYENSDTTFFEDLEDFLNQQYTKQNARRILKETLDFIYMSDYEIEYRLEIDETAEDRTFDCEELILITNTKEFNLSLYDSDWANLFKESLANGIDKSFYKNVKEGTNFINLSEGGIRSILNSDVFLYMEKFNRMTELDKKYPPKESLFKKIINKI
jgi:hypothetical protein